MQLSEYGKRLYFSASTSSLFSKFYNYICSNNLYKNLDYFRELLTAGDSKENGSYQKLFNQTLSSPYLRLAKLNYYHLPISLVMYSSIQLGSMPGN